MAKVDCSELAVVLHDLSLNIAEDADVRNFDDVVNRVQELLPGVDRAEIADSIASVERMLNEGLEKSINKTREIVKEARIEDDLKKRIDEKLGRLAAEVRKPVNRRSYKFVNDTIEFFRGLNTSLNEDEKQLARAVDLEETLRSGKLPEVKGKKSSAPTKNKARADAAREEVTKQRRLRDLDREIAQLEQKKGAKDYSQTPAKEERAVDDAIIAKRQERNNLKKEMRDRAKLAELEEQDRTGTVPESQPRPVGVKTEVEQQIADLREQRRIAKKNGKKTERLDKQLAELLAQVGQPKPAPKGKVQTALGEKETAIADARFERNREWARQAKDARLDAESNTVENKIAADEFAASKQDPKQGPKTEKEDRLSVLRAERAKRKREKGTLLSIEERIATLEEKVRTSEFERSDGPEVGANTQVQQAIEEARAIRDELSRKLDLQRDIKDLADRIESQTIAEPKRGKKTVSQEIENLMLDRDILRREYREFLEKMRPKNFWEFAGAPGNILGSLRATGELSAMLIQAGVATSAHPIVSVREATRVIKTLGDERKVRALYAELKASPNWREYHRDKLEVVGIGAPLTQREEEVIFRLKKIPGIGPLLDRFQNAHGTYLDMMRISLHDLLIGTYANDALSLDERKQLTRAINISTGRGTFGLGKSLPKVVEAIQVIAWAARLVSSRIQLLTEIPLKLLLGERAGQALKLDTKGYTPRVRRIIMMQIMRYLAGLGASLAMLYMLGAEIEFDPRDSDFLKARFGNTTIDIFGAGLLGYVTFASRIASGETKTQAGAIQPIRGDDVPYGSPDAMDFTTQLVRGKLNPQLAEVVNVATGENVIGKKLNTPWDHIKDAFPFPIAYENMYEIATESDGLNMPGKIASSLLLMAGANVNVYSPREEDYRMPDGTVVQIKPDIPNEAKRLSQIVNAIKEIPPEERTPEEKADYALLTGEDSFNSYYQRQTERIKKLEAAGNKEGAAKAREALKAAAIRVSAKVRSQ